MYSSAHVVQVHGTFGFNKILVGRLVLNNRAILFEYEPAFLKTHLLISPLKLPPKSGVIVCDDRVFDGLFGVFNDSLPDGWGRLLLDRKLMHAGIHPNDLTLLDRLCYVGESGMGALSYYPEITDNNAQVHDHLDDIANECLRFQESDSQFIDELLMMNGSSAGARPKIWVNVMSDSSKVKHQSYLKNENHWMIKFSSSMDPKDIGPIEYAYHAMAKKAGLDIPEARLFSSKQCPGYFGVQRFDRNASGFLHMHTASGLLHADHRIPSLDYKTLMQATLWLTKDVRECEKQFRHAVFNVLSHNRDDHGKNFSFLMDDNGVWRVSPAYDLTFSSGPAGEHCTMMMGEGKNIKRAHLLALAEIGNIKKTHALAIIEEVKEATVRWPHIAKNVGVTRDSSKRIQLVLEKVHRHFFA